jgi:hypothetical protein
MNQSYQVLPFVSLRESLLYRSPKFPLRYIKIYPLLDFLNLDSRSNYPQNIRSPSRRSPTTQFRALINRLHKYTFLNPTRQLQHPDTLQWPTTAIPLQQKYCSRWCPPFSMGVSPLVRSPSIVHDNLIPVQGGVPQLTAGVLPSVGTASIQGI